MFEFSVTYLCISLDIFNRSLHLIVRLQLKGSSLLLSVNKGAFSIFLTPCVRVPLAKLVANQNLQFAFLFFIFLNVRMDSYLSSILKNQISYHIIDVIYLRFLSGCLLYCTLLSLTLIINRGYFNSKSIVYVHML
jgi:hypothetical protein